MEVMVSSTVPQWQRSSRCGSSTCVEVAQIGDRVAIRDSKRPDAPFLEYSREEWHAFLTGMKAGEFDHVMAIS
jgi:hypothetical protein